MRHKSTIACALTIALAAAAAVTGTASNALASETGYGQVQLITAQQIDDPPGACTSADKSPGITFARAPQYPEIALEQGLEGFSIVTFTMGLDGKPSDVKLAGTSNNKLMDQAAVDAVKTARFTPAVQNCAKIAGLYGVPVVFSQATASDWPNLVIGSGMGTSARPYIK